LRLTAENAKSAEAKKQEVKVKRQERTKINNELSGLCVLGGKK
jgi:hypothetical protein